jgi:hypothetical protein
MVDDLCRLLAKVATQSTNCASAIEEIRAENNAANGRFNIESLLSSIEAKRAVIGMGTLNGLNGSGFAELATYVKAEVLRLVSVHELLQAEDRKNLAHARLANWIEKARRRFPAEIFTTNYDYLFEIALEGIRWLQNLSESTVLLGVPERCVHIGDRESDIYELFCAARDIDTHFVLRTCVDRLAGDGDHTIADEMEEVNCKGLHRIEVRDKKGNTREAVLELKYRRIRILPPIGKQKRYPPLTLTVIHARNEMRPKAARRLTGS